MKNWVKIYVNIALKDINQKIEGDNKFTCINCTFISLEFCKILKLGICTLEDFKVMNHTTKKNS